MRAGTPRTPIGKILHMNEMIKGDSGALSQQSILLSIEIINFYQWLCSERHEYVMSKQILRSGTSIGANIRESIYASSRLDFINKLQIALKEAAETEYWILILRETGFYDSSFSEIESKLVSIKRLLVKSINTAKSKLEKENN